jgi:Xaa-Pro dipeptidase
VQARTSNEGGADHVGRHDRRLTAFADALGRKGFTAAIVSHPRDLFYLAGMAQPCNLLVVPGEEPLLAARRYGDLVREQATVFDIVDARGMRPLAQRLVDLGRTGGKLGLALDVVPAALASKTQSAFPGHELGDYSPLLMRQRSIKDEFEIEQLRCAVAMFDAAHEAILAHARPGIAEHELSGDVARGLRRAGHEGHVYYRRWDASLQPEGLLASGPNLACISGHAITITGVGMSPALPFGASSRRLERGDLIVIDMGLNFRGYHGDMARTYAVEQAPPRAAALMDALRAAFDAAMGAIRPGALAAAPYEAAVRACEAHGVAQWFQGYGADRGAYVGHGVGVELDELPLLAAGETDRIEAGMVLAIEPKVISPEFGGLDIEDTVVVRESGPERLSSLPQELFVAG